MAKKPRSQRRKKGNTLGDSEAEEGGAVNGGLVDFLPEEHTIADSVTSFGSPADEDFQEFDNAEVDDWLLSHGKEDSDAAAAAASQRFVRLQDALASVDEFQSEKRSTKREATLRRLFKSITQHATGSDAIELIEFRSDELRTACLYSLRVGQPAEQYAACRVLEAVSVALGADQDDWVEALETPLRRTVQMAGRATPVRMAALRAWSMSVFICASDQVMTEALMDVCETMSAPEFRSQAVPTSLRATALDCWALLATTIADEYVAGQDDVQMGRGLVLLELLRDCLDGTHVELRSAAGECTALIHESRLNLGLSEEESENVTARHYGRGSWEGTKWEEVMDEIKQRIGELSVESGYHLSKKAKKEQRATFREFANTIVDDEAPEEAISFRGGSLTLTSWRAIIQLNFIRHCLQGGFQIQLMTNATLRAIFGTNLSLQGLGGMSQIEKRLIMSKTSEASKTADINLSRQRTKRQNIKNHFLTADGDDI